MENPLMLLNLQRIYYKNFFKAIRSLSYRAMFTSRWKSSSKNFFGRCAYRMLGNIVKEFDLKSFEYQNSKIQEFIKFSANLDKNSAKSCANSFYVYIINQLCNCPCFQQVIRFTWNMIINHLLFIQNITFWFFCWSFYHKSTCKILPVNK